LVREYLHFRKKTATEGGSTNRRQQRKQKRQSNLQGESEGEGGEISIAELAFKVSARGARTGMICRGGWKAKKIRTIPAMEDVGGGGEFQ